MSAPRQPLQRVVIAGAGQVGVLAAIAVKRALPLGEVTIIGLQADPAGFADRASTAHCFTNRLHDRLGIAEEQIVRQAGGSHRLVWRLFGWSAPGEGRAVTHGSAVDPALQTRFARDWGGGDNRASTSRTSKSIAEALADAGRFAIPPPGQPTPLVGVDYALRWNPPAYRDLLIARAQQLGVIHQQGPLAGIEPDAAGGIAALHLAGGQRLAADLFIDCTGTAALLLSSLKDYRGEDWSAYLPVRQILLSQPGEAMLALEDRFTLLPEGWLGELAGRDGLQVTLGIAPGTSEQAALATLQAQPQGMVTLSPGRARESWLGNVVGLGDAAARFEPLGNFNLDLAHRQIDLLIELLPGSPIDPLERREYNRRAALMLDALRDTLGAIHAAPASRGVFGEVALSPALEATLDQFTRRGRVPFREEAPLSTSEFQALLHALAYPPGLSAMRRAAHARDGEAALRAFEQQTRAALAFAPPYAEWLTQSLAAGQFNQAPA